MCSGGVSDIIFVIATKRVYSFSNINMGIFVAVAGSISYVLKFASRRIHDSGKKS